MKPFSFLLILMVGLLSLGPLWAQAPQKESREREKSKKEEIARKGIKKEGQPAWLKKDGDGAPSISSIWLPLATMVVLLVGLVLAARKIQGSNQSLHPEMLQILSQANLGPQQRVVLIQVKEKGLLLAVTKDKIELLTEVEGLAKEGNLSSKSLPLQLTGKGEDQ